MKEEYLKISARVKNIDNLVGTFEDNTDEMAQDVMSFEKDFEILEDKKETHQPLVKLQELLDKWQSEEVLTDDDQVKFA